MSFCDSIDTQPHVPELTQFQRTHILRAYYDLNFATTTISYCSYVQLHVPCKDLANMLIDAIKFAHDRKRLAEMTQIQNYDTLHVYPTRHTYM